MRSIAHAQLITGIILPPRLIISLPILACSTSIHVQSWRDRDVILISRLMVKILEGLLSRLGEIAIVYASILIELMNEVIFDS